MKVLNYIINLSLILLFVGCSDGPTSQIDIPDSNLYQYLEKDNPDPLTTLGNGIIKFMLNDQTWKIESLNSEVEEGPISISDLKFTEKPEVEILKEYFSTRFEDFQVMDNISFWNGNILYEIEFEKYRNKVPNNTQYERVELPSFAIMFDPDLYNDIGKGVIYYKDISTSSITKKEVVLTLTYMATDLYFLTLKDITPDPMFKISSDPGTYLVLSKIKILDDNESGNPEVEIFTGGNMSSFYYNQVTSHKFDGGSHIDAAGDLRDYADVNNEGQVYTMDQPIALCRLTNDFKQRLIYIEDDYISGRFAHDENTNYADNFRCHTGIWGKLPNNSEWDGPYTRYFRIGHDNPSNNDDFGELSEIRSLTKSNVPSSYTWVNTTDANYYIKKITYY